VDLKGLDRLLLSIHLQMSIFLKTPELELSAEEVKQLREAGENVAKHFDIPALSEKSADILGFAYALALVYGTRVSAIVMRHRNERRNTLRELEPAPAE
jgi:cobalamin biosynthesis protein CbiG